MDEEIRAMAEEPGDYSSDWCELEEDYRIENYDRNQDELELLY